MDYNIAIRQERQSDFPYIRELVKDAFAKAEHSDGDEHNLIERLRATEEYIPELSLVAEFQGDIIGYIMFSKIKIGSVVALGLAPIAVRSDWQRQGIGRTLIEAGHKIARDMGYKCSIVLGSPEYYSKSGYRPASSFNINAPFNVPDRYYMALPLDTDDIPSGTVSYSTAFNT